MMVALFSAAPLAWVVTLVGVLISIVIIALAWTFRPVESRARYRRKGGQHERR